LHSEPEEILSPAGRIVESLNGLRYFHLVIEKADGTFSCVKARV
jgi:hypothetical protein